MVANKSHSYVCCTFHALKQLAYELGNYTYSRQAAFFIINIVNKKLLHLSSLTNQTITQ